MKKSLSYSIAWIIIFLIVLAGCSRPSRDINPTVTTPDKLPLPTLPVLPATSTLAKTELPITTPANPNVLKSKSSPDIYADLLIMSFKEEVGGLLLGEDGSIQRNIKSVYQTVEFDDNPCQLYGVRKVLTGKETGFAVDRIDLNGTVLESTVRSVRPEYSSSVENGFGLKISPNRNWITYLGVNDGSDSPYDPRFSKTRDLYLVNIQQSNTSPTKVTKRGGAPLLGATWSPDSQAFVYSERDASGVVQIFKHDVVSNRTDLLTKLDATYKDFEITYVQFSPDGKSIVFIGQTNQNKGYGGIIEVENRSMKWLNFPSPSYIPGLYIFWDKKSSQVMTYLSYGPKEFEGYNGYLIAWFDAITGQLIRTFPEKGETDFIISNVFPLQDLDKVGFFGSKKLAEANVGSYFAYDVKSGSISQFELPELCCYPFYFAIPNIKFQPIKCKTGK